MTALVHQFIKTNGDSQVLGAGDPTDGEHYARMFGAKSFFRMEDATQTSGKIRDSITGDDCTVGGTAWTEGGSALKVGRDSALVSATTSTFVSPASEANLPTNEKFSIEFTYQTAVSMVGFYIYKPNHYYLYRNAGTKGAGSTMRLAVYNSGGSQIGLHSTLVGVWPADGNPHHVVYTIDGETNLIELFIDGVSQGTANITGTVNTTDADDVTVAGGVLALQDIAFYPGVVLSDDQIAQLLQRVTALGLTEKDTIANLRLTSDIAGGPIAANAAVSKTMMEAYPDYFQMGTKWHIYYKDEYPSTPIWGGELRDAVASGGIGALVATGYGKRADQQAERFMLQTQNLDNWTSGQSEPIDYNDDPRIAIEVHGSQMVFDVQPNAQFQTNKAGNPVDANDRWTSGMYMWVPLKDLRRVAGTIKKGRKDRNYEFQIVGTHVGPSGSLDILHTENMNQAGNVDFDVAIDPGYDFIGIRLRRKTPTKRAKRRVYRVTNLRVSMFDVGTVPDDLTLDEAMGVLFDQMGNIDYTTIGTSTKEVLPYDAARAPYGQIADELCIFDKWCWGIWPENAAGERRGIAQQFGTNTYYVSNPKLPVELLPEERFNKVFFEYQYAENIYTTDIVTANAPVGEEFPADYDAIYDLTWEDPPPSPVAQVFAQAVADYLVTKRTTGRMSLTSAYTGAGETGSLTRVGHIRPGDKLVLENYDDIEVTVSNVDLAQDGSYANIQFTTGNPLLERWLAQRNRYLNSGRDAAWATLKALDVEQPIAPENVVIGFHRTEVHKGRPKYNLVVDWDAVVEDIDGNGTAIHHYNVRARPVEKASDTLTISYIVGTLDETGEDDKVVGVVTLNSVNTMFVGDLVKISGTSTDWDGQWTVQAVHSGPKTIELYNRSPLVKGGGMPADFTGTATLQHWIAIGENDGGGWLHKTIHDSKADDLSEIDVPTKAVFKDIASPNSWRWEARVRAEDLIGQQSEWSMVVEPSMASAFKPDPPTNVALAVGQHEMEVTWDPPSDFNDGDGDASPSEDIAHYKVRLLKNGDAFKTDTTFTTRHVFKVAKPGAHTYKAQVWSVDSFGNLSTPVAESSNETRETVPTPDTKPTITFAEDPESRDNMKATVSIYYDAASYTDDDINYYAVQWQHSPDANFNSGYTTTNHTIEAGNTTIDIKRITARHYYRCRFRAVDMEGKKSEWGSWTRAKKARIA